MTRILVTGAGGFLGASLVQELARDGYAVRALVREQSRVESFPPAVETYVGDVRDATGMMKAAADCEGVVHLAGKVHVLDEGQSDAIEYEEVNVGGTKNILEGAVAGGAARLVFASTVKVFGETTSHCVDESVPPSPQTAYARSKWMAEQLVDEYGSSGQLTTVSLRLPMVYGPTRKGNLYRMISAIDCGRFPPLPRVERYRSMLHVRNFVQAAKLALRQTRIPRPAYIAADASAYTVTAIYDALRSGLGKGRPRFRMPLWSLKSGAWGGDVIQSVTGRVVPLNSSTLAKLIEAAWYSPSAFIRDLGYRPSLAFEDAVPELIAHYRGTIQ